jgi:protein-disulfide isomerase
MTKRFPICCVLVALIMSLAVVAYITMTTPFFGTMTSLVTKASAQETAEERAQEENKNVQNGFSPANHELGDSRQPINRSENVVIGAINLSPQNLIHSGSPLLGNPFAPVTIVEFGDFQCKFCDRFAKETEPKINATYIQTGKVNMVFKNFVTHGPDSITAAMAAQCANDQGKFWNIYDTLYKNQGEENSGWARADNLKKFASQITGLDIQKFNSCLDSSKYKSFVDKDNAFAISSGFRGTPTFIIEKGDGSKAETLLGAYPFPSFQAIIDKKLSD